MDDIKMDDIRINFKFLCSISSINGTNEYNLTIERHELINYAT